MTPTEFIEWLDKQIAISKEQEEEQSYDMMAVEFCKGHGEALKEVKQKFLTLTPPPTTNS